MKPTRHITTAPRGVAAVLIVLLLSACVTAGDDTDTTTGTVPDGCQEVSIATSPEKFTLLTRLAETFNSTGQEFDGQCAAITVNRVSSGVAARMLAEGWPVDGSAGPAPVLWSPAASSWGAVVNQRLAEAGQPAIANDFQRIMVTPLVLGMPRPMAEALGWPEAEIGWSDILSLAEDPEGWGALGRPEWGQFRLGKTNPNFSTSGLSATAAIYYAATGKTSGLTEADLADPQVIEFVRGVEAATVHYGDTTLTFLDNMYRADQAGRGLTYASAVAVEEVSIIAYNRGDPADTGTPGPPPQVPLVAIYPREGTLYSDNPAYILDAPWVNEVARQAATAFRSFVIDDPDNQRAVLEFGFRPGNPSVAIGDPINAANGLNPSKPDTELALPSPAVLSALIESWEANRKTARIIMLLDVSGSMADLAGEGYSKLELAKEAVLSSLDEFKPEDEIGLWVFSTYLNGDDDYLELISPAPLSEIRAELEATVRNLVPEGGTGLYDSTRAAVEAVRAGFDPAKINAVLLLTDGMCDDDPPGCELDPLMDFLGSSERDVVRVFPVAYGQDASIEELTAIATASQARLYQATNPLTIRQVFQQVISNF
ncbi:MAG TPA: extracellular solute-binding protein [Acidimicrobiia bacterium]|jgi:Ca-activated chloride channel family protein|nr:extracellular solute-binding protein [Acidimicrobiia bacterium]